MYKVFWDDGCVTFDVLAVMEQDIEDGVDVISVSLSFALEPYDDPDAKASFSTMEQGIVITTSSGNEGRGVGILRNGIPWVLTVVADTIDRWFVGIITMGNGMTITRWSIFRGNVLLEKLSLVYDKNLQTCNSFASLLKAQYGIIICNVGNIDNQIKSNHLWQRRSYTCFPRTHLIKIEAISMSTCF